MSLAAMAYGSMGAATGFYDVKDYGAVADTAHLSTAAIQCAIDDCSSAGGGTVLVPSGNYKVGAILLRDNVNLNLAPGATLYASRNPDDYRGRRIVVGAADMSEMEVVLMARGAKNISVTGGGRLHCRAVREQYRREPQLAITDSVTGREIANAIRYGADYRTKYRKVPPCPGAINFTDCENVHIRDIEVIESSGWGVHLQWCERVVVNGVHIQSNPDNGVNSDGLDIDGCTDVMVSDCVINTGDDALCIKTTRSEGRTMPCRWVTVTNCILTSSSAALKLGTESHGDFENITVSNCLIKDANRGINMIIRDGGNVRNILFSDMIITTVRKATFWWGNGDAVWLTAQRRGDVKCAGKIENVNFDNIIAYGQGGVRLEGFDCRMKNIRFKDFQMFMEPENAVDKRARDGFLFVGVDGLKMVDCEVIWNQTAPEPAWESAYRFDDVDGLELVRVKGEKAPSGRFDAFRFNKVRNKSIR